MKEEREGKSAQECEPIEERGGRFCGGIVTPRSKKKGGEGKCGFLKYR